MLKKSYPKNSTEKSTSHKVALLDAGGQYVDLVKKAVERLGIRVDTLELSTPLAQIESKYSAIIISGSPASSHQETAPKPDPSIWKSDLPILGICYGMQSMVVALGGKVAKNAIREDGRITTNVDTTHPIFKGNKQDFTALFTHGDFVTEIPKGFKAIGSHKLSNGNVAFSAIANGKIVGVQFHPEVFDDTPEGYQVFKNFLYDIANLQPDTNFAKQHLQEIIKTKRDAIQLKVGENHVIAFVSGGVDSSVAGLLVNRVVDHSKFHAYYIDSGFMRDEDDMVIEALKKAGIDLTKIDAADKFEQSTSIINSKKVGPLVSTTDPESKRKLIGKTFVEIQNDILKKLSLDKAVLLQGTNAADRIESGNSLGDKHTQTIKTHHNQVKEIQDLKTDGLLIEPLDDLFKDEIRALGHELGLPDELVKRHPFPGPGTAIRIICAPKKIKIPPFQPVELEINNYLKNTFQQKLSARLLPIRSVGVGGDERSHMSVVAIQNTDVDSEIMSKLAHDIPANFRGSINRVIYALTLGSLESMSVTKTLLTSETRSQLRKADRIVFEEMRKYKVLDQIKQMPVVILPLSFDDLGSRSIVLRPVSTSTFMTVQAMLPERDLPNDFFTKLSERIKKEVDGISQVFLDITNKPPATTEWE